MLYEVITRVNVISRAAEQDDAANSGYIFSGDIFSFGRITRVELGPRILVVVVGKDVVRRYPGIVIR